MPSKRYQSLESWIDDAMSDQDKDKPCSAFALMYVKHNDSEVEVHTIPLKGAMEPSNIARLIQKKAEGFAQDLDGISNFRVLAFYGTKEPQAMHPIKIMDGEMRNNGVGMAIAESPDQKGLTQQLMKHLERREEMFTSFMTAVVMRDRDEKSQLQKEVFDAYVIIRDMMMKQMELEHSKRMEMLQFERSTADRKAIMQLLPGMANTILGAEVIPQSVADTALLEGIARKVSPEAIQQLAGLGMLPPELVAPLMTRFKQIIERDKKEAEEIKNLPPANHDPKQDAQGS